VAELGEFPAGRGHCPEIGLEALRAALADYRKFRIEEFSGEKALICTCFGVSEEKIEGVISELGLETVEEVGDACNAGSGCGSCRMLIQEMLDYRV
jgi:NifU-like protein